MTRTSRHEILDGALDVLRRGGTVTLDSVAGHVGLTKPGLVHHFGTKQSLVLAVLDHLVDGYERDLTSRLGASPADATPAQRIGAYLDWSLGGEFDEADLAMFTDPRLRAALTERWVERLGVWLDVPDDLPLDERAALTVVRLLADGSWFADATGVLPLAEPLRTRVGDLARGLLEGSGR